MIKDLVRNKVYIPLIQPEQPHNPYGSIAVLYRVQTSPFSYSNKNPDYGETNAISNNE